MLDLLSGPIELEVFGTPTEGFPEEIHLCIVYRNADYRWLIETVDLHYWGSVSMTKDLSRRLVYT